MPDRELTPKQEEAIVIRMNKTNAGIWDFDKLSAGFETSDLLDWGFEERELTIVKDSISAEDFDDELDQINAKSFMAQINSEISRITKDGMEQEMDELDARLLIETHIVQMVKDLQWGQIEKDITD